MRLGSHAVLVDDALPYFHFGRYDFLLHRFLALCGEHISWLIRAHGLGVGSERASHHFAMATALNEYTLCASRLAGHNKHNIGLTLA